MTREITLRLAEAIHMESAVHSPRTSPAIEAMREAQSEIVELRDQVGIHSTILTETQARCDELGRDLIEARAANRQIIQQIEELQETLRHYQRADMGPVHKGSVFVGGQMVDIP